MELASRQMFVLSISETRSFSNFEVFVLPSLELRYVLLMSNCLVSNCIIAKGN